MQITLNITEDSKVELVKENCELVQGECCFTDFVFNFPETIKGHAISEYAKYIEFAECKDLGECVKFVDVIEGDKYELNEMCTSFKKIMVQLVLERVADGKTITWKTVPFTLEFVESINANGDIAIQTQLLNLTEIRDKWQSDFENTKAEWQAFVKASCLRMVYSSADVPFANEECEGDTIFYLGENNGDFVYGHYYRCVNIHGECVWQDLTQDPSLEGVANGIREINKSRTVQLFVGEKDEIAEAVTIEDALYLPEDVSTEEVFTNVLSAMAGENDYIPLEDEKKIRLETEEIKTVRIRSLLNENTSLDEQDIENGIVYPVKTRTNTNNKIVIRGIFQCANHYPVELVCFGGYDVHHPLYCISVNGEAGVPFGWVDLCAYCSGDNVTVWGRKIDGTVIPAKLSGCYFTLKSIHEVIE